MKRSIQRLGFAVLAVLACAGAQAATFVVANVGDSGSGSLRQAIADANAASGSDTITFSVSGTITLASPLPSIADTAGLTIDGTGRVVTVSGNNAWRVMLVPVNASLTLINLTIANGNAIEAPNIFGGGVLNEGTLTVTDCSFIGNTALDGGGIFNAGTLHVAGSTFAGNSAQVGGGASAIGGNGGGIFNAGGSVNAALDIVNSTFSANTATGQGEGQSATGGTGGAIYNGSGAESSAGVIMTNATFHGNAASGGIGQGGGIANYGKRAYVDIFNSIIAGSPSGGNCGGADLAAIFDDGDNIDDGTTCNFSGAMGSMSSTNPLLGPLAANGGPTQTMALLPGSPAIDGVTYNLHNGAPPTDQRGVARPQGVRYDIGAYELVAAPAAATPVPTLNEWLLAALAGLLLAAGAATARERRR